MSRYTHGHHESVLRSHRSRTAQNSAAYLLPHLERGQRLLDLGSGPGTITADLAALVAPGLVTALEISEEVAALTRAELDRQGVVNAEVVVGDIHALDFDDDSFDVVHAHQVLQHVVDPVRALQEMARVGRPGGVLAARDSDYAGFAWFPEAPELDAWLAAYRAQARANGGEPDAGRRLLSWAREAGLVEPSVSASTWCYATPQERTWWARMWSDRITASGLGDQLVASGLANREQLSAMAKGWSHWADQPDGWFVVLHGELLARPSAVS